MKLELTLEYYEGEVTLDGHTYTFSQQGGRWFVSDEKGDPVQPYNGFVSRNVTKTVARVLEIIIANQKEQL